MTTIVKKAILILVLIFVTKFCFGQDTKKITQTKSSPIYSKEVYYVLKDNKSIKHGHYVKYGMTKQIEEKGQYEMNKRIGVWEFYNYKGELEQKYNYTENKLEWHAPTEFKLLVQTEVDGRFIDLNPEEFPIFVGGFARLNDFVLSEMAKYPIEAQRNGTQGKVLVSAIITKDGKINEEKVEVGIGSGCDAVALKAIQKIPDEWIPAKLNGELKNVKIFYPLEFKLN